MDTIGVRMATLSMTDAASRKRVMDIVQRRDREEQLTVTKVPSGRADGP
jgi:hypothetical protein